MPIETDKQIPVLLTALLEVRSQRLQVFAKSKGLSEQEAQDLVYAVQGVTKNFAQRISEVFPHIEEDLMVYSNKAAEEKAVAEGKTMDEWLDNPVDESFISWTFEMNFRFFRDYLDQHALESSILEADMRKFIREAMKNMSGSMQKVFGKYVGDALKLQKDVDEESLLCYFTSFSPFSL